MSVNTKVLITSVLTSFAFWIPIWLPFAAFKHVELNTAYSLIALYSVLTVILEYPTGVIGDVYSHKVSTILGYVAIALAMIAYILATNVVGMTIGMAIFALGTSLVSGSDQAYFLHITDEYETFYPTMKNTGMVATLFGISVGTALYSINPNLPLIANLVSFVLAAFVLLSLPNEPRNEYDKHAANPFSTAKLGIKTFLTNTSLRSSLIVFALLFAFSNNVKWLYGNLLDIVHLPVSVWGILIAVFYFGRFTGILLQKKLGGKKATTLLLVALANFVFILGYIYHPLLFLVLIFLIMVVIGIVETDLELTIQREAPNQVRSSVLSLKSLLGRGAAAIYITIAGTLATQSSVTKLTLTTFALLLLGIGIQLSSYLKKKESV